MNRVTINFSGGITMVVMVPEQYDREAAVIAACEATISSINASKLRPETMLNALSHMNI